MLRRAATWVDCYICAASCYAFGPRRATRGVEEARCSTAIALDRGVLEWPLRED